MKKHRHGNVIRRIIRNLVDEHITAEEGVKNIIIGELEQKVRTKFAHEEVIILCGEPSEKEPAGILKAVTK